mmetsp:Transcript_84835/g.274194  ORF Transcript_84835/g.274194 Transcript_84835/m.274194 type:complete len:208 (-) Transcript_84835:121-744(-)
MRVWQDAQRLVKAPLTTLRAHGVRVAAVGVQGGEARSGQQPPAFVCRPPWPTDGADAQHVLHGVAHIDVAIVEELGANNTAAALHERHPDNLHVPDTISGAGCNGSALCSGESVLQTAPAFAVCQVAVKVLAAQAPGAQGQQAHEPRRRLDKLQVGPEAHHTIAKSIQHTHQGQPVALQPSQPQAPSHHGRGEVLRETQADACKDPC